MNGPGAKMTTVDVTREVASIQQLLQQNQVIATGPLGPLVCL